MQRDRAKKRLVLSGKQPFERIGDRIAATMPDRRRVRCKDGFAGPCEDLLHCAPSDASIVERYPIFYEHGRPRRRHLVQFRDQAAPALEPSGFELLDQICEDHRSAPAMEKNDFSRG